MTMMMTVVDIEETFDDDSLDDDNPSGPDFLWFQRPAPSQQFTFVLAVVLLTLTLLQYNRRVSAMKQKFGRDAFRGSLRICGLISAYAENDEPTFAVARLLTKSIFFLGLLQMNYHVGFLIMLAVLIIESSLDVIRILLAFKSCESLHDFKATSQEEAKEIAAETQLEPSNVYEDLTRPRTVAVMVFTVQTLLIGIVMFDSYSTPTRSCFSGVDTDVCPMFMTLGSYLLFFLGFFMAAVFYVGPLNSYGKKEHNPVFWLKLFLMSKQTSSVISWQDSITNQSKRMRLRQNDWRIWLRFMMSFIVNSICFHFLLHVLPIQIASKNSIMGVVFSSVGMIYLVDLDDTTGPVLTLVSHKPGSDGKEHHEHIPFHPTTYDNNGNNDRTGYQGVYNGDDTTNGAIQLDEETQQLIEEKTQEVRRRLVAVARGGMGPSQPTTSTVHLPNITHAIFAARKKKNQKHSRDINDEETPLTT